MMSALDPTTPVMEYVVVDYETMIANEYLEFPANLLHGCECNELARLPVDEILRILQIPVDNFAPDWIVIVVLACMIARHAHGPCDAGKDSLSSIFSTLTKLLIFHDGQFASGRIDCRRAHLPKQSLLSSIASWLRRCMLARRNTGRDYGSLNASQHRLQK